jgi:hypothetical protein
MPKLAAVSQLVDDGTGEKTVWRVEQSQLVLVPEILHGVFFSGDCYVVKYKYTDGHSEKYLIYCWLVSSHISRAGRQSRGVPRIFLRGGVQQTQLTEGRENRDLGAVAP